MLQAKVGTGNISEEQLSKMQKVLDGAHADFNGMAVQLLNELQIALQNAGEGNGDKKALIAAMTEPVMQIKANASMFGYQLAGNLANIALNFLENINEIDKGVIDVVNAHHKTLTLIVKNKMSGNGGDHGERLAAELKDACKRYFAKKGEDVTFVE